MSNGHLKLVKRRVPKATDRCLTKLLVEAKVGKVVGVAFVAMLDSGSFIADACGEAHNQPGRTVQMLEVLRTKLADRV